MSAKAIIKNPAYYYNRFLQEVELQTGIRCSKPSEVLLKLTERCNSRCQMCDMWKNNRTSEGELTTEDWKKVLSDLRQWLGKKQIWFTGGEPFLRPDCIELIKYATSSGLSVRVITNGMLLKHDQVPLLVEAGLSEYHVSIDSMSPEIHDHLRGVQGAHKKATGNVLALKDFLDKSGKKMKIVIKTIIMGYNARELLPLVDWAEKNRFYSVLQPLESQHEGEDDPYWFQKSSYWPNGKQLDYLIEIIDQLIEKDKSGSGIDNTGMDLNSIRQYFLNPIAYYEKAKNHDPSGKRESGICENSVRWMELLSRGGLRMCRYMPPQGDVRLQSPRKLWKNRPSCWRKPAELCFK